MDINIEQYNAVIDGLRMQLELQRALTQEKKQEISCLRLLRDGDREKFTKMLSEHEATVEVYLEVQKEDDVKFRAIEQAARGESGGFLVPSDAGYSEAYRIVCALVEAHDAVVKEASLLREQLKEAKAIRRRAICLY